MVSFSLQVMLSRKPFISAHVKNARIAHLATLDPTDGPHIVPVCFVYKENAFYTAVDQKPKRVPAENLTRVRNIRHSPQVALLIDHYEEDWTKLWYVLVRGRASLVPQSAGKKRKLVIRALRAKYLQYRAGMLNDDALIIRITVEQIHSWKM
jgi:PPOX class probable F420-dependent enzyme